MSALIIVNRTNQQLSISYEGPGEIGVVGSGTIQGFSAFPPDKETPLPKDVLSLEVSPRPTPTDPLDSGNEDRWAGKWLKDAN